ncbi:MAG: GSU3473 family protein [Desulfuromonadales bacterium]
MSCKINVELNDGSVCLMAEKSFNIFLSLGKVTKFKRTEGWVVVGKDQLRDLSKINDYPVYAERRGGIYN